MQKCRQCQHDNPVGANFCSNCGAKLKISQAERRQLTILFCDLVDSTPLSEQLDPEEYRQVITDYHQVAEKAIKQYGGHVGQYLGDGLLVYFGYPKGLEDAPKAGVRAGLGILAAVDQANQEWNSVGKTPIKVRIGIHTGLVVVDDHLALGETVNVAARLEGLAPHNGMVISPQTLSLVQGWFEVDSMGKKALKGISEPMEIFQVFRETAAKTPLEVAKGRGLSPLVGRQKELEKLKELWQQAAGGNGRIVLLNGEAGIGKSRLMDAVVGQITRDSEFLHWQARCSPYSINSAFHPLIEMLEETILKFESADSPEDKLIKLETFVLESGLDFQSAMPLLAEFLSIPSEAFPPLVISPVAKRQRTMESLVQGCVNRASYQSILFTLEDLHWSDASTLEWIELFLEQVPEHPILMLCTTRPLFTPDWVGHSAVTLLNLERLTAANMQEICHHQTRGKALPKEILEQIVHKTEGVPLFVEELTKMIMESGFLVEKPDEFELTKSMASLEIPSTLQDSLLARLDRLSDVKDVAQMGAVLGREFSFRMLNAVLPRKAGQLEQSIDQLVAAEIFQRQSGSQATEYQFKHALIQETAYESLLKRRRQQLHHRVANVLEHQFVPITETQPEILAHHYTEAAQPLQAIPIWLKAGQLASKKNASAETIAHLEKGIDLLPHIEAETERNDFELEFRLILGGTFLASHGFTHIKVKETFDRARAIAENSSISPKLALIFMHLISYYTNSEDTKANDELLEYIADLTKHPELGVFFELAYCLKYFSMYLRGNFMECRQHCRRLIEISDPTLPFPWELTPGGYSEIAGKAWLMVCLQVMGHMDQANDLANRHLAFADDYKDSHSLYHTYSFIAFRALEAREWEAAMQILEKYLPMVREFGDPAFTLTSEVYYNIARASSGDRPALDAAAHLLNICFEIGIKGFTVTLASFVAERYLLIDEHQAALDWTSRYLDHVNETGSHNKTAEYLRLKGLILQAQDKDTGTTEQLFKEAIKIAQKQAAKTYELRATCALARLWHQQGKSKAAHQLLRTNYDWFTEGYDSVDLKEARALLAMLN